MAIYKYVHFLQHSDEAIYDNIYNPGAVTPVSGIYRCEGCGREVVSEEGRPLPPQNHHQHTAAQGSIRWRLVVFADHRPK
jgi:hypothetical protein